MYLVNLHATDRTDFPTLAVAHNSIFPPPKEFAHNPPEIRGPLVTNHKTGNEYRLLEIAVDADLAPYAVYYRLYDRTFWARPYSEFLEKFSKK